MFVQQCPERQYSLHLATFICPLQPGGSCTREVSPRLGRRARSQPHCCIVACSSSKLRARHHKAQGRQYVCCPHVHCQVWQ